VAAHAVAATVNGTEPEPAMDPRQSVAAAGCLYAGLLAVAVVWLWWRDRMSLLQTEAVGHHGVVLASLAGLLTGLAGTGIFLLVRRAGLASNVEAQVRSVFAPIGASSTLAIVLFGAVSEEVFFRLAVQDAFGLVGSVAICALVSTCTVGLAWLPFLVLHATALGLLMHHGFGLLGTTTANAILNHLCLRRILNP
jgi:membrane protease YdiL (CAAX protease family)